MTDFSDFRQNPWDSTFSDRVMDPEIHVVAEFDNLPGIYGIALQDRPVATTVTIVTNNTAATPYTEVTTNPLAGQFRVDYVRGLIQFNSADNGDSVEVNYSGRGSNVNIALIQELIGVLTSIFEFITADDTNGLQIRASDNTTVAAIFGEGNTSDVEVGNKIRALGSGGILFEASDGTDVATFGASNNPNASFNGVVSVPDGTAAAPSVKVGDEQNGLYSPGANRMGFVANGVQQAEVNTGGLYAPGHVVQVVSATKTDTFSTSSTSFIDITGLSASITPKSTNSKILVIMDVNAGMDNGNAGFIRIVRESTPIGIGDSAGSRTRATSSNIRTADIGSINNFSSNFLDSPASVSLLTYKLQTVVQSPGVIYVNRTEDDSDVVARPRTISTITLMEIAA